MRKKGHYLKQNSNLYYYKLKINENEVTISMLYVSILKLYKKFHILLKFQSK